MYSLSVVGMDALRSQRASVPGTLIRSTLAGTSISAIITDLEIDRLVSRSR